VYTYVQIGMGMFRSDTEDRVERLREELTLLSKALLEEKEEYAEKRKAEGWQEFRQEDEDSGDYNPGWWYLVHPSVEVIELSLLLSSWWSPRDLGVGDDLWESLYGRVSTKSPR
jgi:hypothetical protein